MSFHGRASLGVAFLLTVLSPGGMARARDVSLPPVLGTSELFASDTRSAVALGGYDPVAYLVDREARPGLPAHEWSWRGLVWRFASSANRAAFMRDPAGFAPRLGGYDALRAASGVLVAADPLLFEVRAGHVYLFRSESNRSAFAGDPSRAALAERLWPGLVAGLVEG